MPQRVLDGIKQQHVGERLHQNVQGSGLHRADRHRYVFAAGNEDDRHIGPLGRQTLLQRQPANIRKMHVEHEATGAGRSLA